MTARIDFPQRIYISGPMTGLPDFNYPAFHRMAQKFRAAGFHVENPAETPEFPTWEGYMRHALAKLLTCDAILMLDGWENSRGAQIERNLGRELGIGYTPPPPRRHNQQENRTCKKSSQQQS